MGRMWPGLLLAGLLSAVRAEADPVTLRFATIVPDGSGYARDAKAFARDVETSTQGRVRVKWVFGAIAGDEWQALERMRRGQIDGSASSLVCSLLSPSLIAFRVPGIYQSREEARRVLARLRPTVADEMRANGFQLVGIEPFGGDVILSNQPVRTLADLQRQRIWLWDRDDLWRAAGSLIGLHATPLPIDHVAAALDEHRLDGLIALPTAALAYQWFPRVRYYTPLLTSYLQACLIVTNRAFDALSIEDQKSLREAGAKTAAHFDLQCENQDKMLLDGLLEKQGLTRVPVSPELKAAFTTQATAAFEHLDEKLLPRALRERVKGWLAEVRSHR